MAVVTVLSPHSADGVLPAGIRQRIEDGEPFVVLCGSAIVEAEDGEALVYLRRGSMCRFAALSHTRWTVADDVELLPVTEAAMVFRERGGAVRRVAP